MSVSTDLDLPDIIGRRDWRIIVQQRRIGRFHVSVSLIEYEPQSIHELLRDMIVVRAEQRYDLQAIEYMAISDKFEEVPYGHCAPMYIAEIEKTKEVGEDNEVMWKHTIKWIRQD